MSGAREITSGRCAISRFGIPNVAAQRAKHSFRAW